MDRRSQRTSKLIQRVISALLERHVNDPRLSSLISVTEVAISSDFKHAKVFVSTLNDEINKDVVLEGLNKASGFLRKQLASHLRLKHTPQLTFHYDDSIERGVRLLKLIGELTPSMDDKVRPKDSSRASKGGSNGTNKRSHNRCR